MNPKVTMVARYLLAIMMLVFGINKFVGFLEMPPIPGDGGQLMTIYFTSGFMKVIGILEVLGGLALLVGKYIPLATTILVAIMFNATLFHVLHDMGGVAPALVGLVLGLILVAGNKERFSSLLSA